MSQPNLTLVGKQSPISVDKYRIFDSLFANPTIEDFNANIAVLSELPPSFLDELFKQAGKRLGLDRLTWNRALQEAREGKQPKVIGNLPVVRISKRSLNETTAEVIEILERANATPVIFRRGGTLATVQEDETGQAVIARYDPLKLRSRMARVAAFAAFHKNGGSTLCAPPMDVVHDVLRCEEGAFPALKGIANVPLLHADGTVRTEPGYDAVTETYFRPEPGFKLGTIPDAPTRADAEAAMQFITNEVLCDFPFDDEADQANALALLLTVVLRHAFGLKSPLFALDAPSPGSGKSLLASVAAVLATGDEPAMYALPESEAELRKAITAHLDTGARAVIFDNVTRTLRSSALASVLTCDVWEDRLLGRTERVRLPQQAVWIATGNNMAFDREIARRICRIKIDPRMSHPEKRTQFKRKDQRLIQWVKAERGALVTALLTAARAWILAGRPDGGVPAIGSFDKWAETVGGILANASVRGFLSNLDKVRAEADEESNEWEFLLTWWASRFGEEAITAATLAGWLDDGFPPAMLPQEFGDKETGSFTKRVAKTLARKVGTRFGERELRIERGEPDSHSKVCTWRIAGDLTGLPCEISSGVSAERQK
jgi:putative DNA primase/helicase